MIQLKQTDRPFLIFNASFWLVLSLFTTIKAGLFGSSQEVHWAHLFSYTFTSGVWWIVFTVLIWKLAQHFTFEKRQLHHPVLIHALFVPIGSGLQRYLSMSTDYLIQTQVLQLDAFPSYTEYFSAHFTRRWIEGMLWWLLITVSIYAYLQLRKDTRKAPSKAFLSIKKKGSLVRVDHADILFVESKANYCYIQTKLERYKMRSSLKAIEAELAQTGIIRIHNSFLINPDFINAYKHIQNGEYAFTLAGSSQTICSTKSYRVQTKNILNALANK